MIKGAPSRFVVDLDAYAFNLAEVRRRIPQDCGILAVVKADAYGHGATPIAERAIAEGARMVGVAFAGEGVALREAGFDGPILVMVQPTADALDAIVDYDLRATISDVGIAEKLGDLAHKANKVIRVHCKVDTGMGRQGFPYDDAVRDIVHLTRISNIDIEGVTTHFASAPDPNDRFTVRQFNAFQDLVRKLERAGVPFEMTHAACSGAVVNFPETLLDMVRVGLMSFGIWPTAGHAHHDELRTVLRWESEVVMVKAVPEGSTIGYGRTYTAGRRMTVALVPVGYADGFPHALSNNADVLIRGTRCPVRGAVSMDQIVVGVGQLENVQPGERVTIIGKDGAERITVHELAERAGTITYEICSNLSRRAPRIYKP